MIQPEACPGLPEGRRTCGAQVHLLVVTSSEPLEVCSSGNTFTVKHHRQDEAPDKQRQWDGRGTGGHCESHVGTFSVTSPAIPLQDAASYV